MSALTDVHRLCHPADAPDAMRWQRLFDGRLDQASQARNFVAFLLTGHPALDDVISVVAEFIANALRHTRSGLPGGTFLVEVRRWGGGIAVAISDQGGPCEPIAGDADDLAESGRGLRTVEILASRWGWAGDMDGRTVIAVFEDT